jgi:hypothetical protein
MLSSQIAVNEAIEQAGGVINNVASVVIPALSAAFVTVVAAVAPVIEAVQAQLGPAMKVLGENMDIVIPILTAIGVVVAATVVPAVIAYAVAMGSAAVATIAAAAPFIAIGAAIAAVIIVLEKMGVIKWLSDTLLPPLTAALDWLGKNVLPGVALILGKMGDVLFPVLGAAISAAAVPFKVIGDLIGWVIDNAIKPLFDLLNNPNAQKVFGKAMEDMGIVVDAVGKVITGVFGAILSVIKNTVNAIITAINFIVDAINSIQIHIHIKPPIGPSIDWDWNGMNLPHLPTLHQGGVVPGTPGSDVLAILQAGERVIPLGQSGCGMVNMTFNVTSNDPDAFARKAMLSLRRELTRQGMSLA